MDAWSGYLARELHRRIGERRADWARVLIEGRAIDHADYRHKVGYVRGLDDAIAILEDIKSQDEKEGPRGAED